MATKPSYTNPKTKLVPLSRTTGSYVRIEDDGHSVELRIHNGYDTINLDFSYYSPDDKAKSLKALDAVMEALDAAYTSIADATPPKIAYDESMKKMRQEGKAKDILDAPGATD